jgi:hypothetical protein
LKGHIRWDRQLICYAGSAAEASVRSKPLGREPGGILANGYTKNNSKAGIGNWELGIGKWFINYQGTENYLLTYCFDYSFL